MMKTRLKMAVVVGDKLVEVHDMLARVLLEDKLLHGEKAMEAKLELRSCKWLMMEWRSSCLLRREVW